jgi:hypothetical protein
MVVTGSHEDAEDEKTRSVVQRGGDLILTDVLAKRRAAAVISIL